MARKGLSGEVTFTLRPEGTGRSQPCQELGTEGSWHKEQLFLLEEGKNLMYFS